MVLPGIQAFFGFQLIAVFNTGFQDLTHTEQVLHLIALLLLAVSIALIMTPAAYHRVSRVLTATNSPGADRLGQVHPSSANTSGSWTGGKRPDYRPATAPFTNPALGGAGGPGKKRLPWR